MAYLVLETGEIFSGQHLGGGEKAGEVVFNTAHSGYEEVATDPSYFSQIMVMTAPHQGNYSASEGSWESERIWIQGFVCVQMQNSKRDQSWVQTLKTHSVPVLEQVDTRALVLTLRKHGSIYGAIVQEENKDQAKIKAQGLIQKQKNLEKDWPYLISNSKMETFKGEKSEGPRVAILDFGCKKNILRELKDRCSEVALFPPRVSAKEIKDWSPHGILLSNGPGDPQYVKKAVETVQELMGQYFMFGICMGCQILALALGGRTRKLKFGHRGVNHPVRDTLNNCIYITSQNHGYVVVEGSLPTDVRVTHTNLNDKTIQGFYSKEKKILAVQFHPENHPGPQDSVSLFDDFTSRI